MTDDGGATPVTLAVGAGAGERSTCAIAADAEVGMDAPARLHLGFVDPSGSLGRRYGSLGVAIDTLATRVRMARASADAFSAIDGTSAPLVARVREHVGVLRQATGLHAALRITVERTPPAHAGFGSGTQLALAIGRAFARVNGVDLATPALARLLARGARSGVGVAAFDFGGFVVDGGPGADDDVPPLLSRLDVPPAWRIVLALDVRQCGLHGHAEDSAIARLPRFERALAADIAHELVMRLLPAVAERDFEPFADTLTRIQRTLGDYFAPAQGGSMFTSADVGRVIEWMSRELRAGIGQSSWGPTGFAFLHSPESAERAVAQARRAGVVSDRVRLLVVAGRNHGVVVEPPAAR